MDDPDRHRAAASPGAVPTTAIGVMIFAGASSEWLGRAIGAFLLLSVPLRRFLTSGRLRVRAAHFPLIGGAWMGRRMLDRMSDRVFLAIIEVRLVGMGLQMLLIPR